MSHIIEAFFALHRGLPRQSAGSDATTRHLLRQAGPLPARPRVLDAGCGPGRSALVLAEETGGHVTAVDLHQPFLAELEQAAARRGLSDRITALPLSMAELPFPDNTFDLIWAEGSVYNIGFDTALRLWRRLLAPGGAIVVTEIEWARTPSAPARSFWDAAYQLRDHAANVEAARAAGFRTTHHWPLPDSDWWDEYYNPLEARIAEADLDRPGMREAVAAGREEIALRREHGNDYQYAGYVLRPEHENGKHRMSWTTRPETSADLRAIREVNLAAFPAAEEADLVEALRADQDAWIDGLSFVTEAEDGSIVGHALLTRCHIGGAPALALAPCAVLPAYQRKGAGSAAIRAALEAARALGENTVVVLGHADYYPRFGFVPASRLGIRAPFEVPDEAMMALTLDPQRPALTGTIRYPAAFGV
ncbi:Predicted N-acetyltransferase YhbS [Saccharopolyspora antimicrobica]|uniref:N-acetyltransferase YhbS n=1 Tax=Saccharopolyspora antimicrobica TaxID=455193 RepID=A0A1I5BL27_9PSEU|nr:putative N-acetyltransferase YhbS [Saccharopolyspora antimicrobica]SFN75475.1 Predicted N-acetyltransferase YhbS [Saccharopolyspora antimicrobica]